MAGKSKKQMHPYVEKLMRDMDCENLFQLAHKTGISLGAWRKYAFEGSLPINRENAERIAKACGITYTDLMMGLASTGVTFHRGCLTLEATASLNENINLKVN
jgi:hypothetical protein